MNSQRNKQWMAWGIAAIAALVVVAFYSCAPGAPKGRQGAVTTSDIAVAAQKTYVPPGDLDEYYMFASGGHSGQVYVYGIPSMRHLSTIPVYTPYPATGYGFDDESKAMLGDLTWATSITRRCRRPRGITTAGGCSSMT